MRAFVIAVVIGLAAALATAIMPHPIRMAGVGIGDIGLPLGGVYQTEAGYSPYDIRLRGSTQALYPFTTMIVLWPLKYVPLRLAAPLFLGVTSAVLAFAIVRKGELWQLLLFLSPAYWSAVLSVQWSPLFTAAILLPPLLPFAVVKPQLGVVLAACGRWSKGTVLAALALVAVSLAVRPGWPAEWLEHGNLRTFNGVSPVTVLPGVVLLAAVLAWRTRDGRLLLAMSVVVQRYLYDQLPLYLVARTWRQLLLLLATSWTAVLVLLATRRVDPMSGAQTIEVWRAVIVALFLPALGMVLKEKNVGRASARPWTG